MKILLPISINILLVILLYLANKNTGFKNISYMKKQIIIGVLFGGVSCFASSFGFDVFGTVANVRDAAPISAGLIFGAPAGIISGFIGGIYRWFSIYWGGGLETRLACTLATILAGLMAAALRKFMFENKKPTWSYAIAITVFCEVIHMLLIFITNMSNSVRAFELVRSFTWPMIAGNMLAVGLAFIAITLISKEGIRRPKQREQIAETFQRWLLACIVIAFLVTSSFTYVLQNRMVSLETKDVFTSAISDVVTSVKQKSDNHMLNIAESIKQEYLADPSVPLTEITKSTELVNYPYKLNITHIMRHNK
jgi:LytS/YehU family sensor histidine kinase